MKYLSFLVLLISMTATAQQKNYFIHLTSDPMENPSSAIKDVIRSLHTVTVLGGGTSKISKKMEKSLIDFSNNGGLIHISEGSISTFGVNKENYNEHLISVKEINWSYPKQLIEESSKANIVFSY